MLLFLKFFLAHLLGDFVFQSEKWVKHKEKKKLKSAKLYLHIGIHLILLLLIFWFEMRYWKGIVFVLFSHFIIDVLKIYLQKKQTKVLLFFIDQLVHLFIILWVVSSYETLTYHFETIFIKQALLLVVCLVFIVFVSAVIIKTIINQWNPESEDKSNQSLAKAGRFIGVLERLFVFVFIITNHWEAIGFLLAAKSVFRFGDLSLSKDRKLTEYILIGTLLSFGIAIATGIFYNYLTPLL
jgi:hypothetical protein